MAVWASISADLRPAEGAALRPESSSLSCESASLQSKSPSKHTFFFFIGSHSLFHLQSFTILLHTELWDRS